MTWVFVTYRYLAMNVMMVMTLVSSLWLIVRYLYDDLMSRRASDRMLRDGYGYTIMYYQLMYLANTSLLQT